MRRTLLSCCDNGDVLPANLKDRSRAETTEASNRMELSIITITERVQQHPCV